LYKFLMHTTCPPILLFDHPHNICWKIKSCLQFDVNVIVKDFNAQICADRKV
jgi:hypothetical protein